MAVIKADSPFPLFTGRDGDPLDGGFVYFGEPDLNPEESPKTVYYDAALTIATPQPLRTLNGYITRNGAPAAVYSDGSFSITVRDRNGALVIYSPSVFVTVPEGVLLAANNLSDVDDAATSLANLGLTATAAELNILDGVTATTAELNYVAGVTSAIQTQLDAKWALGPAPTILSGDMDDLTVGGVYNYQSALSNTPTAEAGVLFVGDRMFGGAFQGVTQIALPFDFGGNTTDMYIRTGTGEPLVYSDWARVMTDQTTLGVGQTWQNVTGSRSSGTSYQNTTGKPIAVAIEMQTTASSESLQVSTDDATWINIGRGSNAGNYYGIIPNTHYYRLQSGADIQAWAELR